jgi:hypothetical protein
LKNNYSELYNIVGDITKIWKKTIKIDNRLSFSGYIGNNFILTTEQGSYYYSNNGIDWSYGNMNNIAGAIGVSYANGYYYIGSNYGLYRSNNLVEWERTNNTSNLYYVAFGNNTYVASGANGKFCTSTDGFNWTNYYTLVGALTTGYVDKIVYDAELDNFVVWDYYYGRAVRVFGPGYANSAITSWPYGAYLGGNQTGYQFFKSNSIYILSTEEGTVQTRNLYSNVYTQLPAYIKSGSISVRPPISVYENYVIFTEGNGGNKNRNQIYFSTDGGITYNVSANAMQGLSEDGILQPMILYGNGRYVLIDNFNATGGYVYYANSITDFSDTGYDKSIYFKIPRLIEYADGYWYDKVRPIIKAK